MDVKDLVEELFDLFAEKATVSTSVDYDGVGREYVNHEIETDDKTLEEGVTLVDKWMEKLFLNPKP